MGQWTFLELAKKILEEEKKPLSNEEIWEIAISKGYDKNVATQGKTPWRTIGAQIYIDIRDNNNTPFIKIHSKPRKFYLQELSGKPITLNTEKKTLTKNATKDVHNASTKRETITIKAIEIIKKFPDGIRYSELIKKIYKEFPHIPVNTIHGTIWDLDVCLPNEIYKPARGLFRHTAFRDVQINKEEQSIIPEIAKVKEEDFYQPFADWLTKELEECTKAIPLGGNKFKDRWGTPDVIGIREPLRSDIIKPTTEIVSAEIKIDTKDLITAFGQACSYKLFSHKSYIVIPKESSDEDKAKIDALCLIFGIGLILFDSTNSKVPQFEIRVRPIKHEPDMFYVNKNMKLVEKELFS